MDTAEIERLIREAIPGAKVVASSDDGRHFSANVISAQFAGISPIKQHQMVYGALKGLIGNQLHALTLKTSTPE